MLFVWLDCPPASIRNGRLNLLFPASTGFRLVIFIHLPEDISPALQQRSALSWVIALGYLTQCVIEIEFM